MNIDDVLKELKRRQGKRSLRAIAAELGVTASYICDLHLRRRDPGPKILGPLGFTKTFEVKYRKASK